MANRTIDLDPGDSLAVNVAACPDPEPPLPDSPPDPDPEPVDPPGETSQPQFETLDDGKVRVVWPAAEGATHYRVTRGGGDPFDATEAHAILPAMRDREWLCVEPRNSGGATARSCNKYEAPAVPIPDPPPPVIGDLVLLHDVRCATGEPTPEGISYREVDWGARFGWAKRDADGYLMTYTSGMEDGRGPGQILITVPEIKGKRSLQVEYEFEVSLNFEDHPIYNKIAHYRTQVPPGGGSGSKFIDKFKGSLIGYATSSATVTNSAKFDPDADLRTLYPEDYGGYNSVIGNVGRDRMLSGRNTVRALWEWVRQDEVFSEGNWYRLRWWLNGHLQGDFPAIPMWGGPAFIYWEIAPTWGGNGGHVKTREDWMRVYGFKTWAS